MTADLPFRRVLIAATAAVCPSLREAFAAEALAGWQVLEADSHDRAQFILGYDACDVLLVDESLAPRGAAQDFVALAARRELPAVVLTGPAPETITAALAAGADLWLPREPALSHPRLLAAGLEQAVARGELRRRVRLTGASLQDSRRHVGRLVDLLWHHAPHDPRTRLFTHRHMLERLQEEIARTARHGTPFSVVLGEVRRQGEMGAAVESPLLTAWAAERIGRAKRRCDVAGQYGPHGFMLLLPSTPEPGAVAFCRRLEKSLSQAAANEAVPLVPAFGIAGCADATATPQGLLRRAEEHLESVKLEAEGAGVR
jgi:diguanylate cyclase (GGDEF)-like protein